MEIVMMFWLLAIWCMFSSFRKLKRVELQLFWCMWLSSNPDLLIQNIQKNLKKKKSISLSVSKLILTFAQHGSFMWKNKTGWRTVVWICGIMMLSRVREAQLFQLAVHQTWLLSVLWERGTYGNWKKKWKK